MSQTFLMADRQGQGGTFSEERSPFDDPDDEDGNISDMEGVGVADGMRHRDMEEMSDVSELSYQSEEVLPREGV